jgi:dynein heavy chain, axonemal
MMDLGRLHSYYSYSLAAFVTVFNRAIDSVSGERDPARQAAAAAAAAAAAVAALEDAPPGAADGTDGGVPASAAAAADGTVPVSPPAESDVAAATAASTPPPAAVAASASAPSPAPPPPPVRVLTDEQLVARCALLRETTTSVTYAFVQRGLFERDRLTVGAHLAFKLLVDAGELPEALVRALVVGPPPAPGGTDPGALPPALAEWLPEGAWARARALEGVRPAFERLTEELAAAAPAWRVWFDAEKPEALPLPGEYAALGHVSVHGLLLLRALRPDRLTAGLRAFIGARLGEGYVGGAPFSMASTYAESTAATPVFFVLFPGVDPTAWVEELGRARGITPESGRLVNISMGQGQEGRAMRALTQLAASGGWVLLQNVHLMTTWLPALERQLELLQETAHAEFRVFISAEPPPLAHLRNVPESLLQSCIKVANEAPAGKLPGRGARKEAVPVAA